MASRPKNTQPKANGSIEPKAPETLQKIEWVRLNWKNCKGRLIICALIVLLPIGSGFLFRHELWQRWKGDVLSATIIDFDHDRSALSFRFENTGTRAAIINDIYFSLFPTVTTPVLPQPLSEEVAKSQPTNTFLLALPPWSGFETINWHPRLNVCLLQSKTLTLPAGTNILTTLIASADTFQKVCGNFPADTPLKLQLHFQVHDASGFNHDIDLDLGIYSTSKNHSWLEGGVVFPVTVQLLPSPVQKWTRAKQGIVRCQGGKWEMIFPEETRTRDGSVRRRITAGKAGGVLAIGIPKAAAETDEKINR